jgi:hypothetical protein
MLEERDIITAPFKENVFAEGCRRVAERDSVRGNEMFVSAPSENAR